MFSAAKRNKDYYRVNSGRINAEKKAWREANPAAVVQFNATRRAKAKVLRDARPPKTRLSQDERVALRKARQKQWYHSNAVRHARTVKALDLKKRYGLTLAAFDAMWEAQGKRCAVCERECSPPHVDHCHETGVVRGLLCFRCNSTAGKFGDDPVLLQRLVKYLEVASVGRMML